MPRLLASLLLLIAASPARADDSPAADLAVIGKKYGIEIVTVAPKFPVKMRSGEIDGAAAAKRDADSYAPIFAFEWSLYPPELIKKTRLSRIVSRQDPSFAKQETDRGAGLRERRALSRRRPRLTDGTPCRKVIHHEFFHIIDLRDDGNFTRTSAGRS